MTARNKVDVRIGGNDYTLVGVESEEYIQKVALYIDRKMNEIMKINNKLSTSMAAVLAAINVADDYFKAHESETQLRTDVKWSRDELEKVKEENERLANENSSLLRKNSSLQLELAKREAEINEVRNTLDRVTSPR